MSLADSQVVLDVLMSNIGLFKMFSRWILHIFTARIQSQ